MRLLQCQFDRVTHAEAVQWMTDQLRFPYTRGYVVTVNVAILMAMRSDSSLRRFVNNAALTVADGQPIVWLSKLSAKPLPERVTGVDLVPGLCQAATDAGVSVYFMGSKRDVVEDTVSKMRALIPDLQVAGVADGYFDQHESQARVDAIRQSGASVLILGMGVPRQERFLEDNWDALGVRLAIPIGGAFDMISNRKPRAAQWIQRLGLEWLWRLYLEPRRLAKRYLVSNAQFVLLSIAYLVLRPWQIAVNLFSLKGAP